MELQRGVVGPEAMMPALAEEVAQAGTVDAAAAVCAAARRAGARVVHCVVETRERTAGTVDAAAAVCAAARRAGARVVHCVVETRPDGLGGAVNCRILGLADRLRRERGISPTAAGSEGARLVAELGEDPVDLVVSRGHGLTPFTSTALDQTLRNLGVTTVVATGVSVNVGILGLCLSAVDLGYQVVLVRDAVAGVPRQYADAVIDNSLAMVATVVSSDELIQAWGGL